MKKVVLLLYLPVLLISGELKDALIKVKNEHKPLLVYVKSDSCQFCEKMNEKTLNSPLIQESIKGFIFATADKNGEEAKKYLPPTRYTPTIYFIAYQGSKFKAVNVVKGYLGKEDFNLWVEDTKRKLGMDSHNSNSVSVVSTTESVNDGDIWMYDIASGMDYAKQTGKQLMVYVNESNTKWSNKMESETFSDASIKEALDDFVWVKIQKGSAEANAYGLFPTLVPTTYFMLDDTTLVAKSEGYFDSKNFLLWINYAKSKIRSSKK